MVCTRCSGPLGGVFSSATFCLLAFNNVGSVEGSVDGVIEGGEDGAVAGGEELWTVLQLIPPKGFLGS